MTEPNDLLALVADRNMEAALAGILSRPKSLRTRAIAFDLRVHPRKDPGCCREGVAYLQVFADKYSHAILVFDHEGCGRESSTATELETELEAQLQAAGWQDRACAIVLEPELEIWVWSDSPHVAGQLGWAERKTDVRSWLQQQGLWKAGNPKPDRPKEAVEAVLRKVKRPRSSALYKSLAEKVSLSRCQDRTFFKLKTTLHSWFPQT
jgi:hypothetical protein